MGTSSESKGATRLKGLEKKINEALYPNSEWQGGFDISEIDKIIKRVDRKKVLTDSIHWRLFALEQCNVLSDIYGGDYGEEFYDFFLSLYSKVVELIIKTNSIDLYRKKISEVVKKSFVGYGYQDELRELYENFIER